MTGYFTRSSLLALGGAVGAIVAFGALLTLSPDAVSWMAGEATASTFAINIAVFLAVLAASLLFARKARKGGGQTRGPWVFLFGFAFTAIGLTIFRRYNAQAFQDWGAGQWWIVMAGMILLGIAVHVVGRWLRVSD